MPATRMKFYRLGLAAIMVAVALVIALGLLATRNSSPVRAQAGGPIILMGIDVEHLEGVTLTLTPLTDVNPVGTTHTVTATLTGTAAVDPIGVTVTFTVSGSNTASGSCVTVFTDGTGQCSFTYTGANVGDDTITATATIILHGTLIDELTATATKTWVLVKGRMTGVGSVFTTAGTRVTHGFELHCDPSQLPNNLEVNWGKGNKFHLETLTSASCSDDLAIVPNPPPSGFDTYVGTGDGTCNRAPATANWKFTDAGEPGTGDTAEIHISGGCTLDVVPANLKNGNHQAHKE